MIVKELVVDVTGRVAVDGPLHIAATVHLPERHRLATPARATVALPGGGYSRAYFDMSITGFSGYSNARHHVDREPS
jgi:hypothetical protein